MHMFRPAGAPGNDLPWTGLFSGMLIGSLWYWCADQVSAGCDWFPVVLVCGPGERRL